MTAGTCTTADSSTRTGRVTRSRVARRATASRQASGTDDVPTLPSCRVTSHPDASRSDSATTPPNHTRTTHGRAGSRAARIWAATGPGGGVGGVGTACGPGVDVGPGATGDVADTTSLITGAVSPNRTAVESGGAIITLNVVVARAT